MICLVCTSSSFQEAPSKTHLQNDGETFLFYFVLHRFCGRRRTEPITSWLSSFFILSPDKKKPTRTFQASASKVRPTFWCPAAVSGWGIIFPSNVFTASRSQLFRMNLNGSYARTVSWGGYALLPELDTNLLKTLQNATNKFNLVKIRGALFRLMASVVYNAFLRPLMREKWVI